MGALYLADFFLTFAAVSRQLARVAYQPHRFAHVLSHLVVQVRVRGGRGSGLGALKLGGPGLCAPCYCMETLLE